VALLALAYFQIYPLPAGRSHPEPARYIGQVPEHDKTHMRHRLSFGEGED
jgi:hypothetical protein